MPAQNQITVFLPGFAPRAFDLDAFKGNKVYLGRGTYYSSGIKNDIQIPESLKFVSRDHCLFQKDASGSWQIVDTQRKNRLVFNGHRMTVHTLHDDDRVFIGSNPQACVFVVFANLSAQVQTQQSISINVSNPSDTSQQSTSSLSSGIGTYPLANANKCVIGRAPDCNIVLDHPTVSRSHCIIEKHPDGYYIRDNNSTNGIIINSEQLLQPHKLDQMDRISIAGFTFIFYDDCLYSYEPSKGGVSLTVTDLYKRVGKGTKEKLIINNVSLNIEPNTFVAIVGGSGAGKTTLLNCMSGMTDFTSGNVLVNGDSISTNAKSLQSLMGYVPQQDIVYDTLTLERMLWYSAKLRMPPDTSGDEINRKIDETLAEVELSDHRKTVISKLSGGERKRASIAVELLASPRLFFLDEPSSGLDPGTEKHLMQMLKRLSQTGKTVIMVTHTVQNLDLCDMVICMGRGGVLCYAGTPKEALRFFNKRKYADIYDDLNENSLATAERFSQTSQQQQQQATSSMDQTPSIVQTKKKSGPKEAFRKFWIMMRRYIEILASSPGRLTLLLAMPVLLTVLVCIAFQADGNIYNYLEKMGLISHVDRLSLPFRVMKDTKSLLFAFSCACFWVGIFNSIQEISKERPIYEREKFSGVGAVPYVLSKFVPLFALCLVQAIFMSIIFNILTNTTATVAGNVDAPTSISLAMSPDGVVLGSGLMWLENFLTTFLCALNAMCLGLLISAFVSNDLALVLCPVCLMPQILFAGVVSPLSGITKFLSNFITCKWSCVAYLVSAQVNNMFLTSEFGSSGWTDTEIPITQLEDAYDLGTKYVFGQNGVQSAWLVMTAMCFVCVVAAIVILRFKRSKTR